MKAIFKYLDLAFKKQEDKNLLYNNFIKNVFISISIIIISCLMILAYFKGVYNTFVVINDSFNILPDFNIPTNQFYVPTQWANLHGIDVDIRVWRGVLSYLIAIYVFFALFSIRYAVIYWRSEFNKAYCFAYLLNIFFPCSLVLVVYNLKYFDFNAIYYKLLNFFQTSVTLKKEFALFTWKRNLSFLTLLIISPVLVFAFYVDVKAGPLDTSWRQEFFFYTFWYYTLQGNLSTFIFIFVFALFPQLGFFRSKIWHTNVLIQITIVSLFWILFIFPNLVYTRQIDHWSTYYAISTFWLHVVNPFVFIAYSILIIKKAELPEKNSFEKILTYCAMYPFVYVIFLICLPFIAGATPYGWIVNLNPRLAIFDNYLDDRSSVSFGNYFCILIILILYSVIFLIAYFYSYFAIYRKIELKKKLKAFKANINKKLNAKKQNHLEQQPKEEATLVQA